MGTLSGLLPAAPAPPEDFHAPGPAGPSCVRASGGTGISTAGQLAEKTPPGRVHQVRGHNGFAPAPRNPR
jgi:hypothetical protein